MASALRRLLYETLRHRDGIGSQLRTDHNRFDNAAVQPEGFRPITRTERLISSALSPRYGDGPFDKLKSAALAEAMRHRDVLPVLKPMLDALGTTYHAYLSAARRASHHGQLGEQLPEWMALNDAWLPCKELVDGIETADTSTAEAKADTDSDGPANGSERPPLDDAAWWTHREFANHFCINAETARKRLDYWRDTNNDRAGKDFQENQDRAGRQPSYLYRVGVVRHIFER